MIIIIILFLAVTANGVVFAIESYNIHHTPPTAVSVTQDCPYNASVSVDSLFTLLEGNTPVTAAFISEPDYTAIGTQKVDILLTDCYGNTGTVTSYINIIPVIPEVTLEASEEPLDISDFLYDDTLDASFNDNYINIDPNKPGTYTIYINCCQQKYASTLTIEDTTAPVVRTKDIYIWPYDTITAEDFILSCTDTSTVTFSFEEEPDTSTAGKYKISLICTDAYNNQTVASASLIVKKDTEAPVFQGVRDIQVNIGDTVSYKQGVTATDNACGEVEFQVDASKVNLSFAGSYQAVYTATDLSGNTTTKTITVTVTEISDYQEKLDELCDKILSSITTESMTKTEKARAIFNYVLNHISYTGSSDKSDWVKGAYLAFTKKRGDCFTYYAASRALLTRAGIDNMEVVRIGNTHYWNLVNLGTGWYHFDASPKSTGFKCFMLTDAEVAAYGKTIHRPEYYDFDASLYPATPETPFGE